MSRVVSNTFWLFRAGLLNHVLLFLLLEDNSQISEPVYKVSSVQFFFIQNSVQIEARKELDTYYQGRIQRGGWGGLQPPYC